MNECLYLLSTDVFVGLRFAYRIDPAALTFPCFPLAVDFAPCVPYDDSCVGQRGLRKSAVV